MKNILFTSLVIFLGVITTSCATVKDVKGPDGSKHKLITCSDVESCYEDATKTCGKYKIINSSEVVADGNSTTKLLVKCKRKK